MYLRKVYVACMCSFSIQNFMIGGGFGGSHRLTLKIRCYLGVIGKRVLSFRNIYSEIVRANSPLFLLAMLAPQQLWCGGLPQ